MEGLKSGEKVIVSCYENFGEADKLKEHKDYKRLKEEGAELKQRLQSVGYAPAKSIFYVGIKQGD